MQPLSSAQRSLYPKVRAHFTGYLDVSDRHSLYYEWSGHRDGAPVLFLHGGPGGGAHSNQRRYFDKAAYRIVLFDQRGCGRSKPRGCLEDNTTERSIEDIEALRTELDIDSWLVTGGSWGSALALAYAQAHPHRVRGLVIWGIFLMRPSEVAWFYQHGASAVYPDAWQHFLQPIPAAERHDLVGAYYRRLCGSTTASDQVEAACAWSRWEAAASTMLPDVDREQRFASSEFAVPFARVECHYVHHGGFFEQPDQLLDGVDLLKGIPACVIQGRHDMVCPMTTAWDLHRRWPEAEFEVVASGAHSSFEPAMVDAIVRATDRFRDV